MPTYCSATDVRAAAAPRVLQQDDAELDAVILLAELDVDMKIPEPPRGDGSLKLDPTRLDEGTTVALARGTAHQVLYRLHMGYAYFIESHQQVGGKDYSSSGAPPKFSPFALMHLRSVNLIPSSGRAWQGYRGLRIRSISQSQWSW